MVFRLSSNARDFLVALSSRDFEYWKCQTLCFLYKFWQIGGDREKKMLRKIRKLKKFLVFLSNVFALVNIMGESFREWKSFKWIAIKAITVCWIYINQILIQIQIQLRICSSIAVHSTLLEFKRPFEISKRSVERSID